MLADPIFRSEIDDHKLRISSRMALRAHLSASGINSSRDARSKIFDIKPVPQRTRRENSKNPSTNDDGLVLRQLGAQSIGTFLSNFPGSRARLLFVALSRSSLFQKSFQGAVCVGRTAGPLLQSPSRPPKTRQHEGIRLSWGSNYVGAQDCPSRLFCPTRVHPDMAIVRDLGLFFGHDGRIP